MMSTAILIPIHLPLGTLSMISLWRFGGGEESGSGGEEKGINLGCGSR